MTETIRMKPALLLVDLQSDHLATLPPHLSANALVARAAALLDGCRARHLPVIHVWTTISRGDDRRLPHWKRNDRWCCVAGTDGHQTPAPLQPAENETVVNKSGFNGFADGSLDAALKQMNCRAVILAGVHLHACVRTAAVECLERGLQVIVAEDAVASHDPVHAAATRRWLAERSVEFVCTHEILSRLDGNAPAKLIHHSPRETEKILFEIPIAGADDIAAITQSAQAAWQIWRRTGLGARCEILKRTAARLEAAAPDLARQMALEIGKPVSHGREEIGRAAANIRDVISRAAAFAFQKRETAGIITHQPLGVIALISPWNNPVAIPLGKIAPALVYGNTVVWKPAPAASLISEVLLQLVREAGVPDGAVRILSGDHTTAQNLAADENVNAVTLTSSAPAGFAIQEICARRFLPLQAELSGNNAAIVGDDADLPRAAAQIAQGAFGFAGQRCTANRRAIVSAAKFDAFLSELKSAAEQLHWGDPLEPSTDIGPVIHAGRREEQRALVSAAQKSGAAHRVEFLFAARAKESWTKIGAYAQPVIVCCDEPGHPLVQEETMSPLLVVQRAKNFAHALKLCNGVRHGLVAALFSDAADLQEKFLAEAQAAILKINSATAGADVSLPFGGWKMSGLGPPEHGEADRLFYTRMQAVYGAANPK
jgi:acyl-CoA reductase-like NAD-dependent aldehyde dehydrogenase/nicotinamidase-related amidase